MHPSSPTIGRRMGWMALGLVVGVCGATRAESSPPPVTAGEGSPVTELDIARGVIDSLEQGQLSREELLLYFEKNESLLRKNVAQARSLHGNNDLQGLVDSVFPRYAESRERILSRYRRFSEVKGPVIEKVRAERHSLGELRTFGMDGSQTQREFEAFIRDHRIGRHPDARE